MVAVGVRPLPEPRQQTVFSLSKRTRDTGARRRTEDRLSYGFRLKGDPSPSEDPPVYETSEGLDKDAFSLAAGFEPATVGLCRVAYVPPRSPGVPRAFAFVTSGEPGTDVYGEPPALNKLGRVATSKLSLACRGLQRLQGGRC
jgi:hypothetical protein